MKIDIKKQKLMITFSNGQKAFAYSLEEAIENTGNKSDVVAITKIN